MTLMWGFIALLSLGMIASWLVIIMLWYRQDTLEKGQNDLRDDLERNYDLDSHQETQIQIMRSKDE